MRIKSTACLFVCSVLAFFLFGCAGVRDAVVDQAAGFPASEVLSDVKKTSDEYKEEQHEKRVDELSSEYEEFLRSREAGEESADEPVPSIMKKKSASSDGEYVPDGDSTY